MKIFTPAFPTQTHQDAAELIRDYFLKNDLTDTVLLVNSLARGQGVPESDLDMAILMQPGTPVSVTRDLEAIWKEYSEGHPVIQQYVELHPFAHLHIDIIDGTYEPGIIEVAEPINYFEVEVGNHVRYSSPMGDAGPHFTQLQKKWLPYYNDELRLQRLTAAIGACKYSLSYISVLVTRGLHFHAVEILHKALQEYLQGLFIAKRFYPIAYDKWIKEQVANLLNMPGLYQKLPPILSMTNIESDEPVKKAAVLGELLSELEAEYLH